jgi:hypothetical protein
MVRKSFYKTEFTRINHSSLRIYYPTGTPSTTGDLKETEMAFGSAPRGIPRILQWLLAGLMLLIGLAVGGLGLSSSP